MSDRLGDKGFRCSPARSRMFPELGEVVRLGLATRGNTCLTADSILTAVDQGIDYLNWCGHPDGMRDAIRRLGPKRRQVKIAVQFKARTGKHAQRELHSLLDDLQTDYLDVANYYYVEHADEWAEITAAGGAAEVLAEARQAGRVRAIGLTSHQRRLAAKIAESGQLDLLMVRYNAAHRGAEEDVFPVTSRLKLPVVAFTCLRWGALLKSTPDDPPGYAVPPASDWYRFALCHPAVGVALMAPDGDGELEENLRLLDDWRGFDPQEYERLCAHGNRVRRHAGGFP